MKKRSVVKQTLDEPVQLESLITGGREAAFRRRHAEAVLLVDEGDHGLRLTDREAAEWTGCSRRTIEQVRDRRTGLGAGAEKRLLGIYAAPGWGV